MTERTDGRRDETIPIPRQPGLRRAWIVSRKRVKEIELVIPFTQIWSNLPDYFCPHETLFEGSHTGPFLLRYINFNPGMNKLLYPL